MNVKKSILKFIRAIINPMGYDVVKLKSYLPAHIINNLLISNGVNKVIDVGANVGQYSNSIIKAGYRGHIFSFEPLSKAFEELTKNAAKHNNWETYNIALGDENAYSTIHISNYSPSSSILPMLESHVEAFPFSKYIAEENIEIKTLDSIFDTFQLNAAHDKIFLKIDTQGYEKKVLDGASHSLNNICGIQLELSTSSLYKGESDYLSIFQFMEEKGFKLVQILPGHSHPTTHKLLQFDAIFFK